MADFDNTNTGTLFKNDTTGKSDKFPPYGGSINVDGTEYWVSAWVKDGKKGKFFSLAIKPKEERQTREREPAPSFEQDTEIPF
jgi:hypothetical protein